MDVAKVAVRLFGMKENLASWIDFYRDGGKWPILAKLGASLVRAMVVVVVAAAREEAAADPTEVLLLLLLPGRGPGKCGEVIMP